MPIPGESGLRAVWEIRTGYKKNTISQAFSGDLTANSIGNPLGQPGIEKFLPGAGCPRMAGAYEVTDTSHFRYKVWASGAAGSFTDLVFVSGANLAVQSIPDPKFLGLWRIGDYTSVDCSDDFAWVAWTDLRPGGQRQVWGARIPPAK